MCGIVADVFRDELLRSSVEKRLKNIGEKGNGGLEVGLPEKKRWTAIKIPRSYFAFLLACFVLQHSHDCMIRTEIKRWRQRRHVKRLVNVDNFITFPEHSADVTHIEIIKPKQSASRRLTGANRVLPFITNMWQGGDQQVTEPTLAATYKAFFESQEFMDERKCEECQLELLSSTHLQYHLKEVHKRRTVMLKQATPERTSINHSKIPQHPNANHTRASQRERQQPEYKYKGIPERTNLSQSKISGHSRENQHEPE
uniref:C2H2-type domain-containing protein n=1 Tax=Timema poppense TaxID=170557 RepID=A0A7R9CXN9_TIMPO|nr:unnamed protein product [Timema poppensis]